MNSAYIPVILFESIVPFPKCNYSVSIDGPDDIDAVRAALAADNYIMLANGKNYEAGLKEDNVYRVGVVGKIKNAMRGLDGAVKINLEGIERGFISEVVKHEDCYLARVDTIEDKPIADKTENDANVQLLHELFEKNRSLAPMSSTLVTNDIKKCFDLSELCDKIGDKLLKDEDDKRDILELDDLSERAVATVAALEKENARANIKNNIMLRARQNMDRQQKEYFLREELKAINDELGDENGSGEEIKKYRELMAQKKVPDYVTEKLEKEFERLRRCQPGAQEGSLIRDYIDTVLALPWGTFTEENKDILKAEKILNEDHYGLEKVKERIVEYLAVRNKINDANAPILCLVGPPGVGKTSIARSMARATGRKYVRMSLGGISDEAEIRGHRRTYLGAMPGRIITAFKQAEASNPLMLLDEIDKLGRDYKGDPAAAFLEVLDGEQNVNFRDNYIEMPYDLSNVLFVCTANSLDTIPEPLRDRLEIVEISSYTAEEKLHIAKDFLVPKQLKANGLTSSELKFRKKALEDMIESYTREAGVRNLERIIGTVCRKVVKDQLKEDKAVNVTSKTLTEYLGRKKFLPECISATDQVGVCRGLAWTSVGGCTLNVEVNILKGKGNFKITGNIGKVMEESYSAALSYIRANADELGIETDFENTDIHIHIPEGATPKDGPSAGITMATAMVSAMTKKPVRKDIAMTGEISIRGKVMPIGGLKEKVLAAKRAGVKKVIIPVENAPDLEEIPEYGKTDMEFVLASQMKDVLSNSLVN